MTRRTSTTSRLVRAPGGPVPTTPVPPFPLGPGGDQTFYPYPESSPFGVGDGSQGEVQYFVVPDWVTELSYYVKAASPSAFDYYPGAVTGFLPVTPGETLELWVGWQPAGPLGGWPDAGDGGTDSVTGFLYTKGGGGSSSIRRGSTVLVIAGGAGGAHHSNPHGGGWDDEPDGSPRPDDPNTNWTDDPPPFLAPFRRTLRDALGGGAGGGAGGEAQRSTEVDGESASGAFGGNGVDAAPDELVSSGSLSGSLDAATVDAFGNYVSGDISDIPIDVPYYGTIRFTGGTVTVPDTVGGFDVFANISEDPTLPNQDYGETIASSGWQAHLYHPAGTYDWAGIPGARWLNRDVQSLGEHESVTLWIWGAFGVSFSYTLEYEVWSPATSASHGGGGGHQGGGSGASGAYPEIWDPLDSSSHPSGGPASGGGGSSYADPSLPDAVFSTDSLGFFGWGYIILSWDGQEEVPPPGDSTVANHHVQVATVTNTSRVRSI